MKSSRILLIFTQILLGMILGCAFGPTPERVGFDYPEAGVKFRPRRHVVSRTVIGDISPATPDAFKLLFPRNKCTIEQSGRRILVTGIEGEYTENAKPLFDVISHSYYGIEGTHTFELTEEVQIDLNWRGLQDKSGIRRVWRMDPLDTSNGNTTYTFGVTVTHYGNTIEFVWRSNSTDSPGMEEYEDFFYWMHGIRFSEPEKIEN